MLNSFNDFKAFGKFLISIVKEKYPKFRVLIPYNDSNFHNEPDWHIYTSIAITERIRCEFRKWDVKPFYFHVFNKSKILCELDLLRVIEKDDKYSWYFSEPRNQETKRIYDSLFEYFDKIPLDYINDVKEQKIRIKTNALVKRRGYLFLENASKEQLKDKFLNLIENLLEYSESPTNWKPIKEKQKIYDLDEVEAIEGYREDKSYLYTQRNQEIVRIRKEKDNYTCQICGFYFELDGKKVIECHHLKPLSDGDITVTKIDDLISVCPTCHRIIHLRKPPFSPTEVKSLLRRGE